VTNRLSMVKTGLRYEIGMFVESDRNVKDNAKNFDIVAWLHG
jgi:hypothetical protein